MTAYEMGYRFGEILVEVTAIIVGLYLGYKFWGYIKKRKKLKEDRESY